jgi:hydroxymethylpyrimidine/phosphomethylpyrimidine kinase
MRTALTIAGSDSGGGAGIQADLKTFHQFGVFGTSVVVAVTAQNTHGVSAVHPIPVDVVRAQMTALASDLRPDACKTGMLATSELVRVVAEGIQECQFDCLVVDPVMVATSGDILLEPDAVQTVVNHLMPLAAIVTPNLREAEILTGMRVESPEAMAAAGETLLRMGARAALVKGGHLEGQEIHDVLISATASRRFSHPRIETTNTHGTGCTLSAAITAGLARGHDLVFAVETALEYVHEAIVGAPGLGSGNGPLNHFVEGVTA